MRLLIQRVSQARVDVSGRTIAQINKGLLVFVGIETDDNQDDIQYLVSKVLQLRIFSDSNGKMNLSVEDINGALLVVSQFTLYAQTKKGNRPSYIKAAIPSISAPLFESFVSTLNVQTKLNVQVGEFGADMQVSLINDGPVTIWMDSKNKE